MKLEKLVEDNALFIGEAVFMLVITGSLIVLFTYVDIRTHDFYSVQLGQICYEGNTKQDCIPVEQLHGCPNGGDMCLEQKYYEMLQVEMFSLAGILIFMKLGLAKLARRKISKERIVSSFIFGSLPVVLLWTGFEDFLYYATRGKSIPHDLTWLNNTGLFPVVDGSILHTTVATSTSLYVVMAIGFVSVSLLLWVNAKIMQQRYATPL